MLSLSLEGIGSWREVIFPSHIQKGRCGTAVEHAVLLRPVVLGCLGGVLCVIRCPDSAALVTFRETTGAISAIFSNCNTFAV